MTVLLGYINCCIVSKNIMLVTFHYAVVMINTPNNNDNMTSYRVNCKDSVLVLYILSDSLFRVHSKITRIIRCATDTVKKSHYYGFAKPTTVYGVTVYI